MQEKPLTKPLKADESDIKAIDKKNLSIGDFVEVYKPKKKDGKHDMPVCDDSSWHQTVSIPIDKFPQMKNEKIAAKIMIVIIGPLMSMDEHNYRIGVDSMAMVHGKVPKSIEEPTEKPFSKPPSKSSDKMAIREKVAGKFPSTKQGGKDLKKTFGGK